mmetsp:Transcript_77504/g.205769  ORF Transcript_77504/g.205769 Transcript_77504/m.205769 type:complete len:208 (-) Transcript_77504:416-1039(-)
MSSSMPTLLRVMSRLLWRWPARQSWPRARRRLAPRCSSARHCWQSARSPRCPPRQRRRPRTLPLPRRRPPRCTRRRGWPRSRLRPCGRLLARSSRARSLPRRRPPPRSFRRSAGRRRPRAWSSWPGRCWARRLQRRAATRSCSAPRGLPWRSPRSSAAPNARPPPCRCSPRRCSPRTAAPGRPTRPRRLPLRPSGSWAARRRRAPRS